MKAFHCSLSFVALSSWLLSFALLSGCSSDSDQEEHGGHDHEEEGGGGHDHDEEGHEEGHIELTEKQFRSAEIEVTSVQSKEVSEALTLPGTVSPNADTVLHVSPRVSGQVRTVLKHLGDPVEKGDLLCIIDSVELGASVADFVRDRAMAEAADETLERDRSLYAGRLEALTTVLDGAIAVMDRIYQREDELQRKAVSTIRPLLEAEKALQLAKFEKDKQLTELRAERDSRLLELDVALRARRIDLTAAAHKLRTLELSEDELAGLTEGSPLLMGEYRVYASGSGVVVTRHASKGEFVNAGANLFTIEDLSSVWFVASAFEGQLSSMRNGQVAYVTLDAFPGHALEGKVSFLGYNVDPKSRSVGVRITLDNQPLESWAEKLPFRPGMFGRAELEMSRRQAELVLPEEALVHEDAGDYVFVQVEAFAFERRNVSVKHVAGNLVEITSGLRKGEMVAVAGTFFLKSAERQGELGGGHSH